MHIYIYIYIQKPKKLLCRLASCSLFWKLQWIQHQCVLQTLPSVHHRYTREVSLQVPEAKKLLWLDVKSQDISCCQRKDAVKVCHVYARASLPPSVLHLYSIYTRASLLSQSGWPCEHSEDPEEGLFVISAFTASENSYNFTQREWKTLSVLPIFKTSKQVEMRSWNNQINCWSRSSLKIVFSQGLVLSLWLSCQELKKVSLGTQPWSHPKLV